MVYTFEQITALLRLFKVYPESMHGEEEGNTPLVCALNGFVCMKENKPVNVSNEEFSVIFDEYGIKSRELNETFHKSFGTVADMTPAEYFAHQFMHYFSTYGAESFGLFNFPTYIPVEKLEIPTLEFPVKKITLIRLANDDEITSLVNHYLESVKAPNANTMHLVKEILPLTTLKTDDIASFEIQCIKHEMDGTVPETAISTLRYLIYAATGETLIIKNRETCERIKLSVKYEHKKAKKVYDILKNADEIKMAEIFLRYKPLFLAFKAYPGCAPIINRYRRLAEKHHKPLNDVALQNLIALYRAGRMDDVYAVIEKASNRDLVKVMTAANISMEKILSDAPSVYSVRNNTLFVKDKKVEDSKKKSIEFQPYLFVYDLLKRILFARLIETISGKTYYIPAYIDYGIPYSEKQMIGNIPFGSKLILDENEAFTAGIHWFNAETKQETPDYYDESRVDLDLHMNSATEHFGWNGGYRSLSEKGAVIYTGDQTDAPKPHGASEAFYFKPEEGKMYVLSINQYSGPAEVDYSLYITKQKPDIDIGRNYVFDPNEALFTPIPLRFTNTTGSNIGVFMDNAFYFYGGKLSRDIVPNADYETFLNGIKAQIEGRPMLSGFLEGLGGKVIRDMSEVSDEEKEILIDLSPEGLTATTLFDIVDGVSDTSEQTSVK